MNLTKLVLLLLFGLIVSCSQQADSNHQQKTYVVKKKALHRTLHFKGSIKPKRETTLTAPVEAIVEQMPVHYGQHVKKNQVAFILKSSEMAKQVNDAIAEYLKAKDSYSVAQARFNGTKELWDAGIIAKNNYLSEKSSLSTARISWIQAGRRLSDIIAKMDDPRLAGLSSLSISEFTKVRKVLNKRHDTIQIKAESDGVLLYPPKGGDDKAGLVTVGSLVKSNQVLGLIGDLNGISVEIDVPEVDIEKVHVGMNAIVRGIAFGEDALSGKLIAVNAQALNVSSGLPSFTAVVEVPKLTPKQQAWIRVGMSADIELSLDSDKQVVVPIRAISQDHGMTVVHVKNKDGKVEQKVITTGTADVDEVVVLSGLKVGEQVVYG